jgi:hypothetical protein
MIRNTDWKWRGDYYDPDLPLAVEVHFRFWDRETERLPAPYVDDFWRRRTSCIVRGIEIPTLSLSDGISYSALHLMRHLFRGDLRLYHVYEVGHFLHETSQDNELWKGWLADRGGIPPVIEIVAFRLAAEWFGCKAHPVIEDAFCELPAKVKQWFEVFGYSPLAMDAPNKDELFLHLILLDNFLDRCTIAARRLLPLRTELPVRSTLRNGNRSFPAFMAVVIYQAQFVLRRCTHHLMASVRLIRSIFRWTMSARKYAVP